MFYMFMNINFVCFKSYLKTKLFPGLNLVILQPVLFHLNDFVLLQLIGSRVHSSHIYTEMVHFFALATFHHIHGKKLHSIVTDPVAHNPAFSSRFAAANSTNMLVSPHFVSDHWEVWIEEPNCFRDNWQILQSSVRKRVVHHFITY